MSGASLPELLRRLSELLPERIITCPLAIVAQVGEFQHPLIQRLRVDREWQESVFALPILEYALREECEARGWTWHLDSAWNGAGSQAMIRKDDCTLSGCLAPTPAHALAAALVAALEARQ